MKKNFTIFSLLLFILNYSNATHLKGGYISVKWLGAKSYQFTLTTYLDSNSLEWAPILDEKTAELIIMEGQTKVTNLIINHQRASIGNATWKYTYKSTPVELPRANVFYSVYYNTSNRNSGIINIPNSVSVMFSFQTTFFASNNSTPLIQNDPIKKGRPWRIFQYNPLAYDAIDGDSLSFKLISPWSSFNTPIQGYKLPSDPSFNGLTMERKPAYITIDPINSNLVWNAPSDYGLDRDYYGDEIAVYVVAIEISEWRKSNSGNPFLISQTTVDFEVEIDKSFTPNSSINSLSNHIKIFPLPAEDYLNIEDQNLDLISWELFDITGKKELSSSTFNRAEKIDLKNLKQGFYLLSLKSREGQIFTKEILIK